MRRGSARAGTHAPLHQGRIAEPDELVQGPRPGDGGHACTRPGRDHALGSVCGQRRLRAGGVRGRCWPRGSRVPAARRQAPFIQECDLYGAKTELVDGLITDAGRIAAERGGPLGWYDVSTLKEPYRLEGKKSMAFELAEQLDWRWPDWIVYPTGGGTGLIGMWKGFEELETIGWVPRGHRPRMVSVQADGCAPIVKAYDAGADYADPVVGRAHGRRRTARAQGCRRLPDAPRHSRERRHRAGRVRRGDARGQPARWAALKA